MIGRLSAVVCLLGLVALIGSLACGQPATTGGGASQPAKVDTGAQVEQILEIVLDEDENVVRKIVEKHDS